MNILFHHKSRFLLFHLFPIFLILHFLFNFFYIFIMFYYSHRLYSAQHFKKSAHFLITLFLT